MVSLQSCIIPTGFVLGGLLTIWVAYSLIKLDANPSHPQPPLVVEVNLSRARKISDTLFGISFEEANHAGTGGLWGELVSNRGFEQAGMDPWRVIGGITDLNVTTELTSCFEHNKVAVRIEVLSDLLFGSGVGICNPGYWGMNIVEEHIYKVIFYGRATNTMNVTVSFIDTYSFDILASTTILVASVEWQKAEMILRAAKSFPKASLQLTTTTVGTIWFDQISAMPVDTYKGQGFRKDIIELLLNLKPRFLRFPGGISVEGRNVRNHFRWKETIGPWENRPSHFNDVSSYWSDNGLGYLEFLQLAEDLGATPMWVVNAGIAMEDEVNSSFVDPLVQDMLDGIEFARGATNSYWGSLRAKYGRSKPFNLRYVAIGSHDCETSSFPIYRSNYLKFHLALKKKYPDINVINNCDPTTEKLDMPAEMFEYNLFGNGTTTLSMDNVFDRLPRSGPKFLVNEYAVIDDEHPNGTLISALEEAIFLMGVERNSDVVSMVCYDSLLMNLDDFRSWKPDVIYYDTCRAFGSPTYWVQSFFVESSGSLLLDLNQSQVENCTASAIQYKIENDGLLYIKVKVINLQQNHINVTVTFKEIDPTKSLKGSQTVLTSKDPYDDNSLENPTKVIPKLMPLKIQKNKIVVTLDPYSITSFDLHLV